jgi:hypothetical protein
MGDSVSYADCDDVRKIKKQWTKLNGLHRRDEWSAAVVRAATAAEIAVNLAVRAEFAERGITDHGAIDIVLRSANGLQGKFTRLLRPLIKDQDRKTAAKKLWTFAEAINRSRNEIVHIGEFRSAAKSKETIVQCREFVLPLVRLYEPTFTLRDPFKKDPKTKRKVAKKRSTTNKKPTA